MGPGAAHSTLEHVAPGSLVVVRDEEWLVTQVGQTRDGTLITAQGLSELVAGTTAQFSQALDTITPFEPRATRVVADPSRNHQRARLWLEATLRKTSLPISDQHLSVTGGMLADVLDYQRDAVRKALDPDTLRPRILLADAVGLGKTLEIGMILAELVRRGRGERILVVTPRHVLEQMQHELWCRFALPFVRLDSVGIQRVRRRLPATRNPFGLYKRAIISIDTLKNDRYLAHLRKHRWDAVVIDESHNITNSSTQNNRLANVLAPQTDALILASATPHNGKKESFAELVRLLEPTAVTADGDIDADELTRLVVRRHRHSPEVAAVVGADWAERLPPQNRLVNASPDEDAIAQELADHWLYGGRTPTPAAETPAMRSSAGPSRRRSSPLRRPSPRRPATASRAAPPASTPPTSSPSRSSNVSPPVQAPRRPASTVPCSRSSNASASPRSRRSASSSSPNGSRRSAGSASASCATSSSPRTKSASCTAASPMSSSRR